MKAIITVVGKDKGGIVAGVATKIAEQDFTHLRNEFEDFGQTLNVKINIQSAAIFDAMYNI